MIDPEPRKATLDHAPVARSSWTRFLVFLGILLCLIVWVKKKQQPDPRVHRDLDMGALRLTPWDHLVQDMRSSGYSGWKYPQVQLFFEHFTPIVLQEALLNGIPPAAVLAIAALESGYDTGYVANVSGNILSLNARQKDPMLPPLHVPVQGKSVIVDQQKLKALLASGTPVDYEVRPPSLKKDYRPAPYAGTTAHLDYFQIHPEEKYNAWSENVQDLVYGRLSPDSRIPAYVETRQFCDQIKESRSLNQLLASSSAIQFLAKIGGKPLSYNVRPSWRIRTQEVVTRLGLELFLREYLRIYHDAYDLEHWDWDLPPMRS